MTKRRRIARNRKVTSRYTDDNPDTFTKQQQQQQQQQQQSGTSDTIQDGDSTTTTTTTAASSSITSKTRLRRKRSSPTPTPSSSNQTNSVGGGNVTNQNNHSNENDTHSQTKTQQQQQQQEENSDEKIRPMKSISHHLSFAPILDPTRTRRPSDWVPPFTTHGNDVVYHDRENAKDATAAETNNNNNNHTNTHSKLEGILQSLKMEPSLRKLFNHRNLGHFINPVGGNGSISGSGPGGLVTGGGAAAGGGGGFDGDKHLMETNTSESKSKSKVHSNSAGGDGNGNATLGGNCNMNVRRMRLPCWTPVRYHEFYHDGDYDRFEVLVNDDDAQVDNLDQKHNNDSDDDINGKHDGSEEISENGTLDTNDNDEETAKDDGRKKEVVEVVPRCSNDEVEEKGGKVLDAQGSDGAGAGAGAGANSNAIEVESTMKKRDKKEKEEHHEMNSVAVEGADEGNAKPTKESNGETNTIEEDKNSKTNEEAIDESREVHDTEMKVVASSKDDDPSVEEPNCSSAEIIKTRKENDSITNDAQTDNGTISKDELSTKAKIESNSKSKSERVHIRKRIKSGALHVARACTCMASTSTSYHPTTTSSTSTTQNDTPVPTTNGYIAIGDTAGYITLYTTLPFFSPISRLETSASRREYLEDLAVWNHRQQRQRQRMRSKRKKGKGGGGGGDGNSKMGGHQRVHFLEKGNEQEHDRNNNAKTLNDNNQKEEIETPTQTPTPPPLSVTPSSSTKIQSDRHLSLASQSPNAIETLCFTCTGRYIIVGTKDEVESIDCATGNILWTVPTCDIPATSLTFGSAWNGGNVRARPMVRGPATRLDTNPLLEEDGGTVLASFAFGQLSAEQERLFQEQYAIGRNSDDHDNNNNNNNNNNDHYNDGDDGEKRKVAGDNDYRSYFGKSSILLLRPSKVVDDGCGDSCKGEGRIKVTQKDRHCHVVGILPKEKVQTCLPTSSSSVSDDDKEEGADCIDKDAKQTQTKYQDLIFGSRSTAIWDRSNPKRMIALNLVFRQKKSILHKPNDGNVTTSSVATDGEGDMQQELFLIDSTTQHILSSAVLPVKIISGSKSVSSEAMNQSLFGTYTIVSSAAKCGIRLFRTDDLTPLAVYGEGVSLHGHTIVWQDCFFIKMGEEYSYGTSKLPTGNADLRPSAKEIVSSNEYVNVVHRDDNNCEQELQGRIIERKDELKHREVYAEQKITVETNLLKRQDSLHDLCIVGVPHAFREPVDLNETIHFWNLHTVNAGGSKLPSFTLQAPKKCGGIVTLLYENPLSTTDNSRFIISTQNGDCQQLVPTLTSDWAGTMYPPGYQIIDDNIIYIEDEDELDEEIVDYEDLALQGMEVMDGEVTGLEYEEDTEIFNKDDDGYDSDLAKALRISMMEKASADGEENVIDVIGDGSSVTPGTEKAHISKSDNLFIPCRPEPYLQEKLQESEDGHFMKDEKGDEHNSDAIFLNLFPQRDEAEEYIDVEINRLEESILKREVIASNTACGSNKRQSRSKKIKPNSIESMINAALKSSLHVTMTQREKCANGSGNTLKTVAGLDSLVKERAQIESVPTPQCEACSGRMVIHKCGKRIIPVDQDAIDRARREKAEQDLENKRMKRRAADAKRRELKRKKKQEEQRIKEAEMKLVKTHEQGSAQESVVSEDVFSNNVNKLVQGANHNQLEVKEEGEKHMRDLQNTSGGTVQSKTEGHHKYVPKSDQQNIPLTLMSVDPPPSRTSQPILSDKTDIIGKWTVTNDPTPNNFESMNEDSIFKSSPERIKVGYNGEIAQQLMELKSSNTNDFTTQKTGEMHPNAISLGD